MKRILMVVATVGIGVFLAFLLVAACGPDHPSAAQRDQARQQVLDAAGARSYGVCDTELSPLLNVQFTDPDNLGLGTIRVADTPGPEGPRCQTFYFQRLDGVYVFGCIKMHASDVTPFETNEDMDAKYKQWHACPMIFKEN